MKISGEITRLIPEDKKKKEPPRVFIRPDDPGVLSKLDGGQKYASGEVSSNEAIDDLEVGQQHEIEIDVPGEEDGE